MVCSNVKYVNMYVLLRAIAAKITQRHAEMEPSLICARRHVRARPYSCNLCECSHSNQRDRLQRIRTRTRMCTYVV